MLANLRAARSQCSKYNDTYSITNCVKVTDRKIQNLKNKIAKVQQKIEK